jgi:hypothetical protein
MERVKPHGRFVEPALEHQESCRYLDMDLLKEEKKAAMRDVEAA